MREINMADSYTIEHMMCHDVLDEDAKMNLRKLYNLGVGDQFLDIFKSLDSDAYILFDGNIHSQKGYEEEQCFSKGDFEGVLIDLTDYDDIMEELGLTKEDFDNASTELPSEHGGKLLLCETVKPDKMDKFFEYSDLEAYQHICRMGLAEDLADILIMYGGDRETANDMDVGSQFGPRIRYKNVDNRIASDIVVKADVAAELIRNEVDRILLPYSGMSKQEYDYEIPGLTDVLRSINYYNSMDTSLEAIDNAYDGHFDPGHMLLGSVEFHDPETHVVSNVCLSIEANECCDWFKLHATAYGLPVQTVEFENAYDLINAIDDVEDNVTKVIDADKIREADRADCENHPIVRMEDNISVQRSLVNQISINKHIIEKRDGEGGPESAMVSVGNNPKGPKLGEDAAALSD